MLRRLFDTRPNLDIIIADCEEQFRDPQLVLSTPAQFTYTNNEGKRVTSRHKIWSKIMVSKQAYDLLTTAYPARVAKGEMLTTIQTYRITIGNTVYPISHRVHEPLSEAFYDANGARITREHLALLETAR